MKGKPIFGMNKKKPPVIMYAKQMMPQNYDVKCNANFSRAPKPGGSEIERLMWLVNKRSLV